MRAVAKEETRRDPARLSTLAVMSFSVAMSFGTAKPADGATIEWTPTEVIESALPGSSIDVPVFFTSLINLEDVGVHIVPELRPFVSVDVSKFGRVVSGEPNGLTVRITVPSSTPQQIVQGTIQLRSGLGKRGQGPVISRPLPVTIDVLGAPSATLVVNVFDQSGTTVGSGVLVTIDGVLAGATGNDGTFVATTSPGQHTVGALIPGVTAGLTSVDLGPGEETLVEVGLASGEARSLLREYDLVVEGLSDDVLPIDFASLTLRFVTPAGDPIRLTQLDDVFIQEVDGEGEPLGGFSDVTESFGLQPDGSIRALELQTVRAVFTDFAPLAEVIVSGEGDLLRYEGGIVLEVDLLP